MRTSTLFERNLISACYAVYLSNGCTIKDMFVTTDTIKGYLNAMARISTKAQMIDPSKTTYGAWAPLVDKTLKEHRRWESMPNRREPITKAMVLHWAKVAKNAHPDSFESAFYDWMVVGKYAGLRKSEWVQDAADYKKTKDFTRNVDGTVKAFILADFEFSDVRNRRITTRRKNSTAHKATIRWRFQKNLDNGQKIPYTKNEADPRLCAVLAARRIYERAIRLGIPADNPIAVYVQNNEVQYMTQREVEREMQSCAKKLYNLTKKEDIARYTAHSVRVGACVALHATGVDILTIQFRLRWRSDKFKNYLRHVNQLAELHNISMNNVSTYGA